MNNFAPDVLARVDLQPQHPGQVFFEFGFPAVFSGGDVPTIDKTVSVGCKGAFSVGVFHQPVDLAPQIQLAARILILQVLEGGGFCFHDAVDCHDLLHGQLLQRPFFVTKNTEGVTEDRPILFAELIKQFPQKFQTDLQINQPVCRRPPVYEKRPAVKIVTIGILVHIRG